jgi:hypothetical protein
MVTRLIETDTEECREDKLMTVMSEIQNQLV